MISIPVSYTHLYAILQNERALNGGQAPIYADPYNLTDSNGKPIKGFGTDWQDLVSVSYTHLKSAVLIVYYVNCYFYVYLLQR